MPVRYQRLDPAIHSPLDTRVRGEIALGETGIDFTASIENGRVIFYLRNGYDVARADDILYGEHQLRGYELRLKR